MLKIEKLAFGNRRQVNRFIELPYRMFKGHPYWVPPFRADMKTALNPDKHPFYEHSEAQFYLAVRNGRDVGRIAVLENTRYNEYHEKKWANFYWFDCEDDHIAFGKILSRNAPDIIFSENPFIHSVTLLL